MREADSYSLVQSQLVTASILESWLAGWLASGCVPALKKKTRRRRFPKSFGDYRVNPSSCHRSASYRPSVRSLALSNSEHIARREAKVQLAMAEWMSLSMVVYCLFGLIISGGNSAKVAIAVGPSTRRSGS